MELEDIVERLERYRQRATYGAVAGVLERPPQFLMQGRPRSMRYSWVVNKETGQPTGYGSNEMHQELETHGYVIDTPEELKAWLARHA